MLNTKSPVPSQESPTPTGDPPAVLRTAVKATAKRIVKTPGGAVVEVQAPHARYPNAMCVVLGELDKFVPLSSQRFSDVKNDGSGRATPGG